jgi:hypothetical protein
VLDEKNVNPIRDWLDREDPKVKMTIVLCATALLILLIILFATNPQAGIGITSLLVILERVFEKFLGRRSGGNRPSRGTG